MYTSHTTISGYTQKSFAPTTNTKRIQRSITRPFDVRQKYTKPRPKINNPKPKMKKVKSASTNFQLTIREKK